MFVDCLAEMAEPNAQTANRRLPMTPDAPERPAGGPDRRPPRHGGSSKTPPRGGAPAPAQLETSPQPPATTPKPPPPKIPGKPTEPTGAIFPPGRAATACPRCRRTRKSSGSMSPPAPPARSPENPSSVATLERRISALPWNFAQRGETFDRADRHVATVLAGVRRTQGRPPEQKEAILPDDLKAMIATLDLGDLRGLRDRAILLIGFAGGLRRSEIVGLDWAPEETQDGTGWIEILEKGMLVTLRGKTGWREVEIGRGSRELTCPVVALETWMKFAQDRTRAAVPTRRYAKNGRCRADERQTHRQAGQANCDGGGGARRSERKRTGAEIFRPFAAGGPRFVRRDRRTLCAKTARPRLSGNDPALPAPARPVSGQSHQSGGVVVRFQSLVL